MTNAAMKILTDFFEINENENEMNNKIMRDKYWFEFMDHYRKSLPLHLACNSLIPRFALPNLN